MNALLNWLDDRTGYKEFLHEALYERIPGGARWRSWCPVACFGRRGRGARHLGRETCDGEGCKQRWQ